MSTLTPTARVILGLVASGPRTGYDVKRIADSSTRFFWGASYGQIYPELRRLERDGLVESSDEPRGRVRRRVYRITPAGQQPCASGCSTPRRRSRSATRDCSASSSATCSTEEDVLDLVRRRRTWFELTAVYFREIGDELDAQDDEVLRYGIELMEWNATWFAASRSDSVRAELQTCDAPGREPGVAPRDRQRDLGAVGLVADGRDRSAGVVDSAPERVDRRARREERLDAYLGARLARRRARPSAARARAGS